MFKGIVKRIVATSVAAASVFLAVVFLGVAIFHAISLVTTPLGASAITFALFALVALVVALVFLKGESHDEEDEEDAPDGLIGKLIHIVRERPIIGAVGGLVRPSCCCAIRPWPRSSPAWWPSGRWIRAATPKGAVGAEDSAKATERPASGTVDLPTGRTAARPPSETSTQES